MSRLRLFVRWLHLWLGLGVGALFTLLGLTGSALVFYEDIDAWLHPEIRVETALPAPGWDSPVWDRALATVRERWPERHGAWRFEATGRAGAIAARHQAPGGGHHGHRTMVWLTPDGTDVLRHAVWGDYAMTWLYDLHMMLLAGDTGRAVVGWTGLGMVALLLSGLWAWWPRGSWRTALHFKREAVRSRRLRDIHKLAGLAGLPLLLMLAITGVMLALPAQSDAVLTRALGPVERPARVVSAADHGTPISLAAALASAHRAMPRARLAWVEAPGRADGAIMVRVQQPDDPSHRFPHSYVWVDQYRGRLLAVQDRERFGLSNRVNNWLHPLHDASVGGLWLRVPVALVGLVPALLFATGLLRWWGLRRERRSAAGRPSTARA